MLDQIAHLVAQMPDHWATAPIYKKGVTLPSGAPAVGKSPLGKAHHQDLTPSESFLYLQEEPDTYGAIGVFSGARSRGLVILDVDANLGALELKWAEDLAKAPRINSPKKNAAKFLFRVAEEHWANISDVSLAASKQGFEVLWGRQGLVCGDYHAGGSYEVVGDLNAVPEAPAWLLAVMRKSFSEKAEKAEGNRLVDSRYAMRTREERIAIARSCLSVIPAPGRGSEDLWWRLGAMVASELPGDDGLELWREWSQKDPEYAEDWAGGNDPCATRWAAGFNKKGLGFGSLVKLANHHDPTQSRFQRDGLGQVVAEIEQAAQVVREHYLSFQELYDEADAIFNDLEKSVGERRYALLLLANRCGIRQKPVQEITEMYLAEREKRMGNNVVRTAEDRWLNPASASYYVPGLLCAGVWLMSGKGGAGKTNTAWRFAQHFLSGDPLLSDEGKLAWERGTVLWLTGDQPDSVTDDQIRTYLRREDTRNLIVENNFNINDYPSFLLLAQKHKPKLVVIDSLRSTHRGTGVSENDSEFALPLRWYEQMMGQPGMFEQCMILVIHHSGHGRAGARGTSALGDMTSFGMNFETPGEKSGKNPVNQRILTFTKHRFGMQGHQIVCTLGGDSTVRLHYIGANASEKAATVQDRIRLKLQRHPEQDFALDDLANDAVICGSEDACKKAVQRLIRLGQCEKRGSRPSPSGKRPRTLYGSKGVSPLRGVSKGPYISVSDVPKCSTSPGTTEENEGTGGCPEMDLSLNQIRKFNDAAWNEFDLDVPTS